MNLEAGFTQTLEMKLAHQIMFVTIKTLIPYLTSFNSGGQGFPPRLGCLRTFLILTASPMPHDLLHGDHGLHSLILQSRGGPATAENSENQSQQKLGSDLMSHTVQ